MSEQSKIRCGVIGTGYLGQHHARIYASLDGCELVGIVEADDRRAFKAVSYTHLTLPTT